MELSKSMKKSVLYWIISAKREETRKKRIIKFIEAANSEQMPSNFQ